MRFWFSCPFRTGINLSTLRALEHADSVSAAIDATIRETSRRQGSDAVVRNRWAVTGGTELRYASLSEDHLPLAAQPLFEFVISPDLLVNCLPHQLLRNLAADAAVISCLIEYYDNTIAICRLTVEFSPEAFEAIGGFSRVDEWSTSLCTSVIRYNKQQEEAFAKALTRQSRSEGHDFFHARGEFRVFLDRNKTDRAAGGTDALWVTRVLVQGTDTVDERSLCQWTQCAAMDGGILDLGAGAVALRPGNSVVLKSLSTHEADALQRMISLCTYFFVLYAILNQNLKFIYLDMATEKKRALKYAHSVARINAYVTFLENEFNDVLMGLQGLRKACAEALLETWEYADLVTAAQQKKDAVSQAIQYAHRQRQNGYARFIEAILAGIGGFAVLEFALNLIVFSRNEKVSNDAIVGLVDLTRLAPADGVLYFLLLVLLMIFLLSLRKRRV